MSGVGSEKEFFQIRGMDCASCARSIEEGVRRLPGVEDCEVNFSSGRMSVKGTVPAEAVQKRVRDLGFRALPPDAPGEPEAALLPYILSRGAGKAALAGVFLILPGLIWNEILVRHSSIVDLFSVLALIVAGFPVAVSAFRSLIRGREININVLMTLAAIGAVIIGAFTEAGMVMVLFVVGELLEGYTVNRARSSLRGLIQSVPGRANRIRSQGSGEFEEVGVEALEVGDLIAVKPGERIPIDGHVRFGHSGVNQAPITGESRFIDKGPDDPVYAGTINGMGSLSIQVSRPASDSTLNRMIRLIEESRDKRAPTQRFVDRFARIYTPSIVALALLVAVLPPLLWNLPFWNPSGDESGWLYRGLALLVVACPCALVISTPVSIISAISQAARNGVLFKGGASLETLSRVRSVAFDKTGTLTEGSPVVIQVRSANCTGDGPGDHCENCDDLVALVSAVERQSEHPLARALVTESILRGVEGKYPAAAEVTAQAGQGVIGRVGGRQVQIGSHRYFDAGIPHDSGHCAEAGHAADQGYTPVLVSVEGQYLGYLSLEDTIRQTSREAIEGLRRMGLASLVMLTGDNQATALKIAAQLGFTEVHADLMPEGKVGLVQDLKARHGAVAMVGDGLNDAPALSSASIGIALGGSAGGTDHALETADITLMGGDLRRLPYALRLSQAAMNVIKANVALSLAIKLVFLILVLLGLGTMWMAVAADVGTSLLVTLNGMRLLRWPRPHWDMTLSRVPS